MAILDNVTEDAERDIGIERLSYLQRADLSDRMALMSGRRGRVSLLSGYLGAAEAVSSGIFRGYAVGNYKVPTPKTP
jgi:hypothetical protein